MATRTREKAKKLEEIKDKRPKAIARYIRISSSKVRFVLDTIRGKKVSEAVGILENLTQAAASVSLKVLKSAVANAENNMGLNKDDLFVAEAYATPGPILKRISFRARGRADRISKRSSHITIVLDSIV